MEYLSTLFHPAELQLQLQTWGWLSYPILFAIIFAETGILAGFFFPGDSLLFIAGFVCSLGYVQIWPLTLLLIVAAITGDATGYFIGKKTGEKIFFKPDSLLFKKEYLYRTKSFYEKHGGKTIVLARFIPIVRTFAPFMAGVGNMGYRKFALYNITGGIAWITSMLFAGYFLGNIPLVKANLEKTILLIIFISLLPVFHQAYSHRKQNKKLEV